MDVPFTVEQFLGVFGAYNRAVWPMQIVLYAVAAAMVVLATRPRPNAGRWIGGLLAFLWSWMGIVYHWGFFRSINPAALVLGALFILQAGLFLVGGALRSGLTFRARRNAYGVAGSVLIAYALLVYPLVGAAAGHAYPNGPTLGLPCPTTIFTFGLLLWADRPVPVWMVVIPALWSLLGVSAAISFGIVEDYLLPLSGVVATGMIVWRNRKEQAPAGAAAPV